MQTEYIYSFMAHLFASEVAHSPPKLVKIIS